MKKFILLAMFIIFGIIFTLCYRDFPQNHQDSPEGSYITDYGYFNGDDYDNRFKLPTR